MNLLKMDKIPNCPCCGKPPRFITMVVCINKACELCDKAHFKAEWIKRVNNTVKPRDAGRGVYRR